MSFTSYPQFKLYNLGQVSSAHISGPSGTFELRGLSPEPAQHLTVTVKDDKIEVPWTMYLPIYQFGTIVGRRTFDVSLSKVIQSDDMVEIRSNVSSFRLIPSFSRTEQMRKELGSVLRQGISVRVEEGNKANRGS